MVLAQHTLARLQGAPVERLGLAVAALEVVQKRQIVDAGERLGMLLAERALAGLQSALQERLGLAIAALSLVQKRQIIDADQRSGCSLPSMRSLASKARLKSGSASP